MAALFEHMDLYFLMWYPGVTNKRLVFGNTNVTEFWKINHLGAFDT